MAIQFMNQPDNSGLYQSLGGLLGGLGGGLLGYGLGKLGGGNEDEEIEQFVKAKIMTPEQAKIYRKLKTPQERSSFLNQTMKQNEASRQNQILASKFGGGNVEKTQPGIESLQNLGDQPQQKMSAIQNMQELLGSGLSPQNLGLAAKVFGQEEKSSLARESLQAKKEAPHRVQVAKQVADYQRKGELADRLIADYDAMKIMADNPQLRTGAWQQLMTQAGIPTALQSDASFVADKLIGDITIASAMKTTTPGKLTARLLEEYAKVNPTRLSSPQGMKDTLELKKMAERVEKITADKINEIIEESPGGLPPINIIQRAQREVKPEVEKIHKEQQEFARKMVEDAKKSQKSSFKVGKKYSGMPDPTKVARYRDPETGMIMKLNPERNGYVPE